MPGGIIALFFSLWIGLSLQAAPLIWPDGKTAQPQGPSRNSIGSKSRGAFDRHPGGSGGGINDLTMNG